MTHDNNNNNNTNVIMIIILEYFGEFRQYRSIVKPLPYSGKRRLDLPVCRM